MALQPREHILYFSGYDEIIRAVFHADESENGTQREKKRKKNEREERVGTKLTEPHDKSDSNRLERTLPLRPILNTQRRKRSEFPSWLRGHDSLSRGAALEAIVRKSFRSFTIDRES